MATESKQTDEIINTKRGKESEIQKLYKNYEDNIILNFKEKQHNFENIEKPRVGNSELESQCQSSHDSFHAQISNMQNQNITSNQFIIAHFGFSNEIWKKGALRIIYHVFQFLSYIVTKHERLKFRSLTVNQFNALDDRSSNYEYYIQHGFIKRKIRQTSFNQFKQLILANNIVIYTQQISRLVGSKIKVIRPNTFIKITWDVIVLLILIMNIMYIPMKVSFTLTKNSDITDFFFDSLPTYVFILEVLLNFNTAYYSHGVLVVSQQQIAKHYIQGNLLMDLIVLIPFIISKFNISFIEIILLLRINRVVYIMKTLEETLNLREKYSVIMDLIKLIFFYIFVSHLIACAWHFIGILEINQGSNNTWIHQLGIIDDPWEFRYITCFYWAVITTLTIGYGDITPKTEIEKSYVILVALMSSVVFGFTISQIGMIFSQMSERKKEQKNKVALITSFIKKRGLSKELQFKVKKFFEYYFKVDKEQKQQCEELINNMTSNLKREVKIDIYKQVILSSKFFRQTFSDKFINSLCSLMKERSLLPEETIYLSGDKVDQLYFIVKGEVDIFVSQNENKQKTLRLQKRGTTINEKAFITQSLSQYSARSMHFSVLAYLSYNDFTNLLRLHSDDREKFYQVRSQIIFCERVKFSSCQICNFNHDFILCPFMFYLPNPRKLIKYQESQKAIRQPQIRIGKPKSSSWKEKDKLQEKLIQYIIKEGYLQEEELDQNFMKKYGVDLFRWQASIDKPDDQSENSQNDSNQSFSKTSLEKIQEHIPNTNTNDEESQQKLPKQRINQFPLFHQGSIKKQLKGQDTIFQPKPESYRKSNSFDGTPSQNIEEVIQSCDSALLAIKFEYYLKFIKEDCPNFDAWWHYKQFYPDYNMDQIIKKMKYRKEKMPKTPIINKRKQSKRSIFNPSLMDSRSKIKSGQYLF